ncbi:hypothetical protein [Streptomyces pratensis]|uniref:hypothetical protein n=1 Tax=Streptomyces pratensis TaxID=1169025 RepID=UPI00301A4C47
MHRVGIESDQLVYDYLSRVGDLAQRHQLSSGARMRLVAELRGEIDRQRGAAGADSPAAVRRVIGRLGSPEALVAAAAAEPAEDAAAPPSGSAAEASRRALPRTRGGLLRREPGGRKERGGPGGPEGARASGPAREAAAEPGEPRGWGLLPKALKAGSGRGASHRPGGGDPRGPGGELRGRGGEERPGNPRDESFGGPRDGRPGDGPPNDREAGQGAGAASVPRPAAAPDDLRDTGPHGLPGQRSDGPPDDRPFGPHSDPGPGPGPASTGAWPDPFAPHVLAQDQRGGEDGAPDWWRLDAGPFDEGVRIPGFSGGIEAPELLKRRPEPGAPEEDAEGAAGAGEAGIGPGGGPAGAGAQTAARRRAARLLKLRRRKAAVVAEPVAPAPAPARRGFAHPLLLLAAVLLVAGVVTGSWWPLAGGWLIAYSSRTLSRTEAKWAALGLPGVVAAGALVWVWGRLDGRWGDPVRDGALGDVLIGAWPVVVRVAAVASALYLVWRARRRA